MKKSRLFVLLLAVLTITLFVGASPAFGAPGGTVRVWVQYSPGHGPEVQAALENAGAQFHYSFPKLESFVVTLSQAAAEGIGRNPNVVSVEEDAKRYPIAASPSAETADLLSLSLDTIDANGQTVPWGIDAVQARDVWDANRDGTVDPGAPTGAGRTVCIIDTGYYQSHEDLPNAVGGQSQVDNDWSRDGYGHGTHVGGTIAAQNNSIGVVGVTPGTVSLYIIKIFDDTGTWTLASDLVAAINSCAANGANVVSMSLGGSRSNGRERRAFDDLYNQGILSVAAAGNDGTTAYSYPASYSSVISVAAIDESLNVADFSQQNDQVELSGPGVGVLSTLPYIDANSVTVDGVSYDANHIEFSGRGSASGTLVNGGLCDSTGSWSGAVVLCERGVISFYDKVLNVQNSGGAAAIIYNNAPGNFLGTLGDGNSSSIIGVSLSQADGQFLVANKLGLNATVDSSFTWPASGYEAWNGTSMATPHVSAAAALIWSANPSWTNQQVRDALDATAQDLGAAGRDNAFGYGLVKAYDALQYLGGGTVNNPPTVNITSPSNGASFASGATINFAGTANDAEDGDLTASLVWTSNIDGQIGTGGSFSAVLSDGTHTITASATDSGGKTGSDSITITVGGGGGGQLVVTVTTDKATYTNHETVTITVHVTDGTNPVQGATVNVSITTASGNTLSGSGTTNASGDAVFTYRVNSKRDGTGTYTVNATASKSGYTAGNGSTTFVVQ